MNNNTRNNILIALAAIAVMAIIYGVSPYKPAVSVEWLTLSPSTTSPSTTKRYKIGSIEVLSFGSMPSSANSATAVTSRAKMSGRCLQELGLSFGSEDGIALDMDDFALTFRKTESGAKYAHLVLRASVMDSVSANSRERINACLGQ